MREIRETVRKTARDGERTRETPMGGSVCMCMRVQAGEQDSKKRQ